MDIFKAAESLMRMDDEVWARHANPMSAYTRLLGSIPLFYALYSFHWIGWKAVVPIGAMIVWTVLNPRLFPPPAHTRDWATRGVLGERVFLNRKSVPIADEHVLIANISTAVSAVFLIIAIYGFVVGDFWVAFAAFFGSVLAKVWFVDRMTWIWSDMKDKHAAYTAWDRADWTASTVS